MLSLLKMPFVGRWLDRHKAKALPPLPIPRPLHRPEQRCAASRLSGPLTHDNNITLNGKCRPERAICGHSAPWAPTKHDALAHAPHTHHPLHAHHVRTRLSSASRCAQPFTLIPAATATRRSGCVNVYPIFHVGFGCGALDPRMMPAAHPPHLMFTPVPEHQHAPPTRSLQYVRSL